MRRWSSIAVLSSMLAAAMCFSTFTAFGADDTNAPKETRKSKKKQAEEAAAAAKTAAASDAKTAAVGAKTATADAKTAVTKDAKTAKTTMTPAASDAQIKNAQSGGQVWVNTESKVYHKSGRWYGKTKQGKFMSEADAKAAGFHEDKGEAVKK